MSNATFEILYCVGILFVVDWHTHSVINLFTTVFPYYSFDLPLLHLHLVTFTEYSPLNLYDRLLSKKCKRLLLLFYIWTLVYGIIAQILQHFGSKIGMLISIATVLFYPLWHRLQFMFNWPLRYLHPHHLVELLAIIPGLVIHRNRMRVQVFIFLTSLFIGIIGVIMERIGYTVYRVWWVLLVKVMLLFPIYIGGIVYNNSFEHITQVSNPVFLLTSYVNSY